MVKRDRSDPHGVRVSTFEAVEALSDDVGAPVRWRSATVANLVARLDAAKIPVGADVGEVRRAVVFLLRGRLVSNSGRTNRYAMEEVTASDVIDAVVCARLVASGRWEVVPARGGPGWPLCTACGQPVDPAALAGVRASTHPACDVGESAGE